MEERTQPGDAICETDTSLHNACVVEIITLGGLDIRFRGKSLIESRSGLRRVLELLKYLIAFRNRRYYLRSLLMRCGLAAILWIPRAFSGHKCSDCAA